MANKIRLHQRLVERWGAEDKRWPIRWDDVHRFVESWTEEDKTLDEMEELVVGLA